MKIEVCTKEILKWDPALYSFFLITYLFRPHLEAYGILVPQPGTEPTPPALDAWSLNHWTARNFPKSIIFKN